MSNNNSIFSYVAPEPPHWLFWFTDKRATVYLIWLIIVPPGFVHLYFEQPFWINWPWLATCAVGLGYMAYVMRPFDGKLKPIFLAWLFPLLVGMIVSFLAASVPQFYPVLTQLALVWAVVQAAGYALNGIVDPPSNWYWLAAGLHVLAAVFMLAFPAQISLQWLLLAVISVWSLLNLWLFRSVDD